MVFRMAMRTLKLGIGLMSQTISSLFAMDTLAKLTSDYPVFTSESEHVLVC